MSSDTMQALSLDAVTWHVTLSSIELPDDAIVIADRGLPSMILDAFEDPILVQAGESLKTLAQVGALADEVLTRRATRPLTLVAVGGGSIGDAVGFLASILWRGVSLWHIPTTLLAMVDSAHGGKTAVNLARAKNQLGTFYLAERICIVREVLEHLPYAQREEGLAELIKGLWLDDAEALDELDAPHAVADLVLMANEQTRESMFELLKRAVAVKYNIVAQDPRETLGIRTWLNLGHTVAHALELELGMSHGQSVAWGMVCMARVSQSYFGLDAVAASRLLTHLEPLLYPMPSLEQRLPKARFEQLVRRDKKRIGDQLRSVVLRGPAQPEVTTEVSAEQWYEVLLDAYQAWSTSAIEVTLPDAPSGQLEIAASKSEVNRAIVIKALRLGATEIEGPYSYAQDVVVLRDALERMAASRAPELSVHVGMGGTTLRFLLGVAAVRPGRVRISAHPRLWERPHEHLLSTLRSLGATITWDEAAQELVVDGVKQWRGGRAQVRCDASSQFASALALIGAAGQPMTITLDTDEAGGFDPDRVASRAYLQMTVDMLKDVGVDATWYGRTINLNPTAKLSRDAVLTVYADESSAAVWRAARALGVDIALNNMPESFSRQADGAVLEMLATLTSASADEHVVIDLHDAPDLAPVLVATAVQLPCKMTIVRAEHLRIKESNRIEDLVSAMHSVGIAIEATDDGIVVPFGAQRPDASSRWATHHDHRFVMAGILLTLQGDALVVEDPQVVAKSYPTFWHHARWCGWQLTVLQR